MEYNSISINYPILKYLSLETSDKINNKKQRTDKKEEKKPAAQQKLPRKIISHQIPKISCTIHTSKAYIQRKSYNTKEIKQKFIEECKILHNFTCVSFANGASKHAQLLVQF
jgi:hypothetical protein